jgi:hypothetical protein
MAIEVPRHVTGLHVIDDLLARIEGALLRTGDLRSVDSYASYSAKVTIQLQLVDINQTEIKTEVNVGTIEREQPFKVIALDPNVEGVADEPESLERPVDPAGAAEAQRKRQYISLIFAASN